jgi:mannose-6-phosphate isomerase-like protein (cupin superfamily)
MEARNIFDFKGRFFQGLEETEQSQTAVMTIAPGADAGPAEVHGGDQIIYIVEGEALVRVGEAERRVGPGALLTIPGGTRHHVRNPGRIPLFFLTVYAPPEY